MIGRYAPAGFAFLVLLQIHLPVMAGEIAPQPGNSSISFTENVRVLVRVPFQRLGESNTKITGILGHPLSTSSEDISNRHQSSQRDRIKTITYEGLVIQIYEAGAREKEMLLSVRMTKNRPGVLPVLIGVNEETIKTTYGNPEHVRGTIYSYVLTGVDETGEDRVNIQFENSIVVAVEWNYYVD